MVITAGFCQHPQRSDIHDDSFLKSATTIRVLVEFRPDEECRECGDNIEQSLGA
jgi:hypothetical protein